MTSGFFGRSGVGKSNADASGDAAEIDLAPATGTDIIGVDVGDGKVEGRGSGKWIGYSGGATWGYGTGHNVTMVLLSVVRHPSRRR